MISELELHWLVGLLEGEGCFSYDDSPGITLGMTDLDVVERVAKIFDRKINGPYQYGHNRKPVYYVKIWSAEAVIWMETLLPYMGNRRSAKIDEILARWRLAPGKGHRRGTGLATGCHPDRKHYAHGQCRSCYRKTKYAQGEAR